MSLRLRLNFHTLGHGVRTPHDPVLNDVTGTGRLNFTTFSSAG